MPLGCLAEQRKKPLVTDAISKLEGEALQTAVSDGITPSRDVPTG